MGPPGDQADATFDFFFTDTELSSGAQYSVSQEETTEEPTQESVRIQLYSSDTSADADHPNHWNAVENFGSGAAFNGDATDPAGTYSRVFQITSGEGYGAGVHVAFAAFPGIGAGFTDGADHFNAKVYGSPLGNLEVKFIGAGEGLDSVATIDLDTYAGSIDEGNGWYSVSIPFSEFSNADQIANHSGYLMGPPGDQADATFDFFFTDTELSSGAQYTTYSDSPVSPADLTGYALVFEDEFNAVGESPDSTNWTFDLGNDGWGNGEAQDYQSGLDDAQIVDWDPSTAVNGALRITAKNVDGTITSARVKSDIDVGPYGYYEVRAKLPSEAGAWPAIWLLGEGGRSTWPADGEIDLVEWSSAYASGDTEIISALHYPAAHGESANDTNATLSSAVDEWHTYQLWWTPDSIKIGVDGTEADSHLVYSKPENATNNTWPYDGPMDLILNIAIGGTLGGTVPSSNFEYAMEVDYVRIYQQDGTVADLTPPELTLTFDSNDGSGFVLTDFGGNASSVVAGADAPTGSDGSVVKVLKTTGAETWAGTTFFELSGDGELISDGGSVITADVFSAKDGVAVRLKLEDSSNGNIVVELDAITESNGSDAWETLSWDLSAVDGLNHLNNYDKASIFFDFGNAGDGEVYYFDNVNFGGYIA
jgi:beta-glucanase (GH16 family)